MVKMKTASVPAKKPLKNKAKNSTAEADMPELDTVEPDFEPQPIAG